MRLLWKIGRKPVISKCPILLLTLISFSNLIYVWEWKASLYLLEAFMYMIASVMAVLSSNFKTLAVWIFHVIIVFFLYIYGVASLFITYEKDSDLLSFIVMISIYYFALKSAFRNSPDLYAHVISQMKPMLDIVGFSIVVGISVYSLDNIVIGVLVGGLLYASFIGRINHIKK